MFSINQDDTSTHGNEIASMVLQVSATPTASTMVATEDDRRYAELLSAAAEPTTGTRIDTIASANATLIRANPAYRQTT